MAFKGRVNHPYAAQIWLLKMYGKKLKFTALKTLEAKCRAGSGVKRPCDSSGLLAGLQHHSPSVRGTPCTQRCRPSETAASVKVKLQKGRAFAARPLLLVETSGVLRH